MPGSHASIRLAGFRWFGRPSGLDTALGGAMSKAIVAAGTVVLLSVLSAPVFGAVEAVEERPMTLEEIVDAVNSGVSEEVLRIQIEESGCDCRTGGVRGAVALQRLKEAGVSDDFIRFLIRQGERPRGEPAADRRVRPTAAAPAAARDRGEVFGGYSFLRTEGDANLNGWAAAFAARLTGGLELVGDLSGHYGSVDVGLTKADVDAHTVLFGPRFGGGRRAGARPFVQALAGLTRVGAGVDLFGARISESTSGLAVAVGGGVDLRAGESLAVRMIQADYVNIRLFGEHSNNVRLSAGLVFRF
jgi:hypothetical protein